ncbi:MAG: hypothetical protein ABI145_02480 [Steroidobacteraceae bacterium]
MGTVYLTASGDTSGATDTANFKAAYTLATIGGRTVTGESDPSGTVTIRFGYGTFYITAAQAMMSSAAPTGKIAGLIFKGEGSNLTTISYTPASSGPLCLNQRWLLVRFEGFTFLGNDANSDFLDSFEQGGATNIQDYKFTDVVWNGSWQNIHLLTGGNNNSEWKWNECTVDGTIANWLYIPSSQTGTFTNGSNQIALTNTSGAFAIGSTITFATTVGTGAGQIVAGTTYFIVAATATNIQVSATSGGTPITPNATTGTTSVATVASDQFLNFWWKNCKFWDVQNGSWINSSFGGHFVIEACDISNNHPSQNTYIFQLLGSSHSRGVCDFLVDGLRIEHATDFSLLLHSQWPQGNIGFNHLDESPLTRTATDAVCKIEIVNVTGSIIEFRNSQLSGLHNYVNNSSNWNFQSQIIYENCTLLANPSAASFISMTAGVNTGGFPNIRFNKCRNTSNAATVGYHEIVDSDVNWYLGTGATTHVKTVSILGANSDWPAGGGILEFRFPLNAMITQVRFFKPANGNSGAFQYTLETTEATPTVLAGGAATPMAGANAGLAIPIYTTTPNFVMSSDAMRTIKLVDTLGGGRSGIFTGLYCLVDYIG